MHLLEDNIQNTKCSLCVFSSLIFLTNVFLALYYYHYFYAFLFLSLTITSVVHHTYNTFYTSIIDKIFVYSIIFYGGYILYNKYKDCNDLNLLKIALVIVTFLLVVFLYAYGYLTDDYSFHPNPDVCQMYHCWLHVISSIGHHFIIIL
jgi:hypothetical protein